MSDVNIPLLRKAVEWVEAEAAKPADLCEWEQGLWVTWRDDDERVTYQYAERTSHIGKSDDCGTCYCVAGYVASQLGEIPAPTVGNPDADEVVPNIAAEALGIESSGGLTPGHLFYLGNTAEDVRRIAEELAGERL